jgi:hypothetical protein
MGAITKTFAATIIASTIAVAASEGQAATFAAWEVSDVPFGDVLNVRKYPSNGSQKQGAYPNGTVLQMTGRCTGGVNLKKISHLSPGKQMNLVRFRWCEIWHDPSQSGNFVTGWVYGKYIAPY